MFDSYREIDVSQKPFWGKEAKGFKEPQTLETQLELNKFKPRSYQQPIFDAFFNEHFKRMVLVICRRAGKDLLTWNILLREAITKTGVYYMVYPTYAQGKKILWNSCTNSGIRFIDYIPKQLINSVNSQEMLINLKNGSYIQIIGSDDPDRIVGTNPRGVVFSEYALQNPMIWSRMSPMLVANGGWAIFQSTPRGHNHFYHMYNVAEASPDWWTCKLGLNETMHVPVSAIQKEIQEGLMSEDLVQQEWYSSFDAGVEGSIYCKYIDRMNLNRQLTTVPWESGHLVHTAWDLGITDPTCVVFFQKIGQIIKIIDFYDKRLQGIEHYCQYIKSKPYQYGIHIAPFDIMVKDYSTGGTRKEKAAQLGIDFKIAPSPRKITRWDGIEGVRSILGKVWIDETRCAKLIKAMENYQREFDQKTDSYKEVPLRNWATHGCDALRMMAISLPYLEAETTEEELKEAERDANGMQYNLPPQFRDDDDPILDDPIESKW